MGQPTNTNLSSSISTLQLELKVTTALGAALFIFELYAGTALSSSVGLCLSIFSGIGLYKIQSHDDALVHDVEAQESQTKIALTWGQRESVVIIIAFLLFAVDDIIHSNSSQVALDVLGVLFGGVQTYKYTELLRQEGSENTSLLSA